MPIRKQGEKLFERIMDKKVGREPQRVHTLGKKKMSLSPIEQSLRDYKRILFTTLCSAVITPILATTLGKLVSKATDKIKGYEK